MSKSKIDNSQGFRLKDVRANTTLFSGQHTVRWFVCLLTSSKPDKHHLTFTLSKTFSKYQLNAQIFYSSTICMLHYDPQHVSSSTLHILRRTNCITTASGIATLCKQP